MYQFKNVSTNPKPTTPCPPIRRVKTNKEEKIKLINGLNKELNEEGISIEATGKYMILTDIERVDASIKDK